MKKYFFILLIWPLFSFGQESKYYLTKRDTLYIYFDENIKSNFTTKFYSNITKNEKNVGLETQYLLFSDSIKINKDILFEKEKTEEKKGLIVARPYRSREFGANFKREDSNIDYMSIKNNNVYYNYYLNEFLTKNENKYDSISFDKQVVYKKLNIQNESGFYSSIILDEKKLKKLNVFIYDATHKNFSKLLKLISDNFFVLFIYREKINFRYSTINTGLLFDEVIYVKPDHRL